MVGLGYRLGRGEGQNILNTRLFRDNMKLLITGGAGFIGSSVIRHIIQNTQDEVINLDKLTYAGNLESLLEVIDSSRVGDFA